MTMYKFAMAYVSTAVQSSSVPVCDQNNKLIVMEVQINFPVRVCKNIASVVNFGGTGLLLGV